MDNQNRYEEVPQEQGFFKKFLNFFAKMFITLGHYLRNVAFDFVNSFRRVITDRYHVERAIRKCGEHDYENVDWKRTSHAFVSFF